VVAVAGASETPTQNPVGAKSLFLTKQHLASPVQSVTAVFFSDPVTFVQVFATGKSLVAAASEIISTPQLAVATSE